MHAIEKKCKFCGESILVEAVKCRFCGEFLEQPAGGQLAHAEQARHMSQGHDLMTDTEVLFEGHASRIALIGPVTTLIVWTIIAGLIVIFGERLVLLAGLSTGHFKYIPECIAAVVVMLVLFYSWSRWMIHKSRLYRITNDRIEYEQGLFSKNIQNMDMWRVQDVGFTQGFFQKLCGLGVIRILSSDKSDPQMNIGPIHRARQLYDLLKKVQLHADRRRGVIHVEN
ncbi:PH domain-containing protein [Planctomycetota bacterium]